MFDSAEAYASGKSEEALLVASRRTVLSCV